MIKVEADKKSLAEFQRDLHRLSKDLGDEDGKEFRREMRQGAKGAAEIVAAEARRRVPVGKRRTITARDGTRVHITPGKLKKSIKPKVDPYRGRVAVVAGVPQRLRNQGSTATKYRRPYWAAWENFGHDWVELGTRVRRVSRTGARVLGISRTRVGRYKGSGYLSKAMSAKSREAQKELERSLQDLLDRYNRKFKAAARRS